MTPATQTPSKASAEGILSDSEVKGMMPAPEMVLETDVALLIDEVKAIKLDEPTGKKDKEQTKGKTFYQITFKVIMSKEEAGCLVMNCPDHAVVATLHIKDDSGVKQ